MPLSFTAISPRSETANFPPSTTMGLLKLLPLSVLLIKKMWKSRLLLEFEVSLQITYTLLSEVDTIGPERVDRERLVGKMETFEKLDPASELLMRTNEWLFPAVKFSAITYVLLPETAIEER